MATIAVARFSSRRLAAIALVVFAVSAAPGCERATEAAPAGIAREAEDRKPDGAAERLHFDALRRLPAGDALPPMDAYPRAQARRDAMRRYSAKRNAFVADDARAKADAATWEFLGPENVAGRTRTLVFDPRDARRMLAGGVSGGLFESRDGGSTWAPLGDGAVNVNVGALVIDPVEPDTLYFGTGELYRNSGTPYASMWGRGILRSRDGGATLQQLVATASDDFRYVADLAISPHDHRRVYAATNTGIWRSDDAGQSFRRVLRPVDAQGRDRYEGCNDLLVLPDPTRDRVLATCSSRSTDDRYWEPGTVTPPACGGPCPASVFLNEDAAGDGAWTAVLEEPGMGRTTMDYARSQPSTVYAVSASIVPGTDRTGDGIGDYDNGLHAVWRSDDGGRTWRAQVRHSAADTLSTYLLSYADTFDAQRCGFGANDPYSAGWYNQAIAVDPRDPEIVWVAGMEHYRSDDGGRTFGKASYWDRHGALPAGAHADQHFLVFHPQYDGVGERRLYGTNDGGITVAADARATVSRGSNAACSPSGTAMAWTDLTRGLATTQFYTGAVTADGTRYLGGLQDNGTLITFNPALRAWRPIFGGDGASVAIDPRNPQRLYVSYQYVNLHRSDDGGNNFVRATSGIVDAPNFIMPFVLDQRAPDRLYAGGRRVWRTSDRGGTWRAASTAPGFDNGAKISALAISPVDNERALAGDRRAIRRHGAVSGATGDSVWASTSPRDGWVSSLVFDPVDANRAYATYSTFGGAHVWRSDDAGASWTPIDGTGDGALPDVPVHTLAIDPRDTRRLFIGTDVGVFTSIDGGARWSVEATGFGPAIVESLQVAPGVDGSAPPRLYAFTYGRGVWRVPLADLGTGTAYRIGADTSGVFFDPAQGGQGFVVHASPLDGVTGMLAAWYTFNDGAPVWLIGSGIATAGSVRIPLFITRGGAFPPAFDPASVVQEPWGELVLDFADRDHARATWTTNAPGFASGTMPLQRLAGPGPADTLAPDAALSSCHAGVWYDAARGGHGLMVEIDGSGPTRQLLLAWYVYAGGQQRWLIGSGPISGDTANVAMSIASGGDFPPDFDAADVRTEPWGTLQFRAVDRDRAWITWTSNYAGFNGGTLSLSRLSSLLGYECR